MSKKLLALLAAFMFLTMVSCSDDPDKTETDNEVEDKTEVEVDDDVAVEDKTDTETPDDDEVVVPTCKLDSAFMEPNEDYTSWYTMKLIGKIITSDESETALISEAKYKDLDGAIVDVGGLQGVILSSVADNDEKTPQIILLTFGDLDQSPEVGDVSYKVGQIVFPTQHLQYMKQEGLNQLEENGSSLPIIYQLYFDQNADQTLTTRKQCIVNVAEIVDNKLTGDVFVCHDGNETFAAGETLKIMMNTKMFDNEADILTMLNTEADGTVVMPGEEGYSELCTCFKEDGTTEEPCDGGEEPTDEDVMTDADSLFF